MGDDIIEGINTGHNKPRSSTVYEIEISKSEYKLEVEQSGKAKEKLTVGSLLMQIINSHRCLVITTSTLPLSDYRPSQLTHKLICPYIFGDEKEHIIVSNWRETGPTSTICTDITVDGKNYSVIDTDKAGNTILLVTLD